MAGARPPLAGGAATFASPVTVTHLYRETIRGLPPSRLPALRDSRRLPMNFWRMASAMGAGIGIAVAACSSGGSSSQIGAGCVSSCGTTSSNPMQTNGGCAQCAEAHCASQATAALGSGSTCGGACGTYLSCIDACPCDGGGATCFQNCGAPPAACTMALQTLQTCENTNCSTSCTSSSSSSSGSSSGSGSSGSSSGGVVSGTCTVYGGNTCPTANLVGCCKVSGVEVCYYSPTFTASEGQSGCTSISGTWSTSM